MLERRGLLKIEQDFLSVVELNPNFSVHDWEEVI